VLHLLLVEDNPADVLMVREALRTSAIAADVMIAYDGEQALRLLCEMHFKPDFIILDLAMPKFDGFKVLEQYRAQDGPPVVVFTNSRNEQEKQRALALGARDYVMKPIGFHPFIEAVQGIVERWGGAAAATQGG
jgi:DNA-binding response OmpR family regulator